MQLTRHPKTDLYRPDIARPQSWSAGWCSCPPSARTLILLTGLISAALIAAPAHAGCRSGDPEGLFKGTAVSGQAGKLEVTLNLRCKNGDYSGQLITPVGKFDITGGGPTDGRLLLTFGVGAGAIEANLSRQVNGLGGSFRSSDDTGSLVLERMGDAVAGDPSAVRLNLSPAEWRQDLAFFGEQLRRRHGAPFHRISRSRFDAAIGRLAARTGKLDPDSIYVELDRLATMIGDGHTFVIVPPDAAQMPLLIRLFGDEYRVVATTPDEKAALGGRLVGIGGVPIARAERLALGPTPADETWSLRRDRTSYFLTLGMMLHGLGISPARQTADYRLRRDDGSVASVTMHAVAAGASPQWTWTAAVQPLYRQHPDAGFWCSTLEQGRTVYCSFSGYDDLASKSQEMLRLLKSPDGKRLVVDLRLNTGGDFNEGKKYVIEPIARNASINRRGNLYVLIGRSVFSAGMSNAAQFRSMTNAVLVGEPIGERPNSWQEAREFTLPNSHLVVRYSTKFYRFAGGKENLIRPDVTVAPTWAQYSKGEDPVLDWVLRQKFN